MRVRLALALLAACLFGQAVAREFDSNGTTAGKRQGKVFSLFNVVQFKNDGCRSSISLVNGGTTNPYRNGTCMTSSQCTTQGGTASGVCAAGFGVCCVLLIRTTGSTVTQNCSYIQNPGFPTGVSTAGATTTYTVNKQDCACAIRLDFETFTLEALNAATTCQDTFSVQLSNGGPSIPTICGTNTGQHMYLDVGQSSSASSTLTFTLGSGTSSRAWDIKVSQIPCGVGLQPDCLQYLEGITGIFSTFNYKTDGTGRILPNQHYSACIRQEEGFCCVRFAQCSATNSFDVTTTVAANAGFHDAICRNNNANVDVNYIGIPGSSGSCLQGTAVDLSNTYCGTALTQVVNQANPMPICDCTPPFRLDVYSSTLTMASIPTNKGACITYTQLPCV